jgi:hypothetical protein
MLRPYVFFLRYLLGNAEFFVRRMRATREPTHTEVQQSQRAKIKFCVEQ